VGKEPGRSSAGNRQYSNHALLADSCGEKTQNVHAASDYEFGRDANQNPTRMGQILQLARHLETLGVYANTARAASVCFHLKAVSPNVASTGIATDSARRQRATLWARGIAKLTRRLFQAGESRICMCLALPRVLRQARCACWAKRPPSRFAAHGRAGYDIVAPLQ
jgi:hypothetical protein